MHICCVVFASGLIAGIYYQNSRVDKSNTGTECMLEAKICPDGSAIGRQSPNCEFPECTSSMVACTEEARICPDGSAVARQGPSCQFPDCPDTSAL